MRISWNFACVAAAGMTLALAACGDAADAPVEEETPSAAPVADGPPGITGGGGYLTLPAVEGNPGAAYFTLSNSGSGTKVVSAAGVLGTERSEMHGEGMVQLDEIILEARTDLEFAPGGMHVMVFGVPEDLAAGDETEITLIFANGDKVSIPLEVRSPGDAPAAE